MKLHCILYSGAYNKNDCMFASYNTFILKMQGRGKGTRYRHGKVIDCFEIDFSDFYNT